MAHYLEDRLGYPNDQALAASKPLLRVTSPEKPNAVLDFLCHRGGLSLPHLHCFIRCSPSILTADIPSNLLPKLSLFHSLLSDVGAPNDPPQITPTPRHHRRPRPLPLRSPLQGPSLRGSLHPRQLPNSYPSLASVPPPFIWFLTLPSSLASPRYGAEEIQGFKPESRAHPRDREALAIEDVPQAWDLGDQGQARRCLSPPRAQGSAAHARREAPQILPC